MRRMPCDRRALVTIKRVQPLRVRIHECETICLTTASPVCKAPEPRRQHWSNRVCCFCRDFCLIDETRSELRAPLKLSGTRCHVSVRRGPCSTSRCCRAAEDVGSAGPGGPGAVPHPRRRCGVRGGSGVWHSPAARRPSQRQSSRQGYRRRGRDVDSSRWGPSGWSARRRTERRQQKEERSRERRDAVPEGRQAEAGQGWQTEE